MKILKFPIRPHPNNPTDQRRYIKLQEIRTEEDRRTIMEQSQLLKKQRERIFKK